tara:strand:+ start:3896 stop:4393 length:498 start_codon:yes stop_codon:yes gene_type:complete
MKAILGNFTKISETEFRLKKNLQFAEVALDHDNKVKAVMYEDSQEIEVGDILTHNDKDYEILDINTDEYDYIKTLVRPIVQEQDVPEKKDFTPRKSTYKRTILPTITKEQDIFIEPKIDTPKKHIPIPVVKPENPKVAVHKPKKLSILKRIAKWLSDKLTNYSSS